VAASNQQKHQAGRHLAVAHALLQGLPAKLVGPQTHVEINGPSGVVMLAAMGAWQIADIAEFLASDQERYVLVDVTNGPAALYLVPGNDLRHGVRERHTAFLARVGGTRPRNPDSGHTKIEPADVNPWRNQWSLFKPSETRPSALDT
jgi:hypothetical protein